MKKKSKKILIIILVAAIWLAVWEVIHLIVGKDILVPSPWNVFLSIINMGKTSVFWLSIGASILRIILGYLAALVVGIVVGTVTALSKKAEIFFSPIAKIITATPVASFIILLFVFLVKDNIPGVTAFLMVTPMVWANVFQGIKSTDVKLLEMAEVFELEKNVVIRKIYFPNVMPYFMAAVKTGMGLGWKAGIAAEVLTNPSMGIGTMLYNAKVYLETTELFAWTVVIVIISIILEKLLVKLISRVYPNRQKASK